MTHDEHRLHDLVRFYEILDILKKTIGGPRILAECNGRMGWPERGVYFFQEHGETRDESGTGLRIVRVGTHALINGAQTTLWQRLAQHRGTVRTEGGNHRSSIFRLLVGTALASTNGLLVPTWGNDREHDRENERQLEVLVSKTIGQMPFLWLGVPDQPGPNSLRGYIERNAIALLSNYNKPALDAPSPSWLGAHCDRLEVRDSGLWNVRDVNESYDPEFLDKLEELVGQMGRR